METDNTGVVVQRSFSVKMGRIFSADLREINGGVFVKVYQFSASGEGVFTVGAESK